MSAAPAIAAGVDGCRAGWFAVIRRGPEEAPVARVFPRFDVPIEALGPGSTIAVDMPIGLPERIEGQSQEHPIALRQ